MNRLRICALILTVLLLACNLTIPLTGWAETVLPGEADASADGQDKDEAQAGVSVSEQVTTGDSEDDASEAGLDVSSEEALVEGESEDETEAEQSNIPEIALTSEALPDNSESDSAQQDISEEEELNPAEDTVQKEEPDELTEASPEEQASEKDSDDEGDATEGVLPEENSEDGKPVLYIVLVDCGTTLYGKTMKNAIVTSAGDPNGTLLALIAAVPPLLCPEANIIVFGYHSELVSARDVDVVPMSNTLAISQQVQAILDIEKKQRQSADLVNALSELDQQWVDEKDWSEEYDCRLVILTGGAMFFATDRDNNPISDDVRQCADTLREEGITIKAFGYDLADSAVLNPKFPPEKIQKLLLDASLFEADEYTAIELPDKKKIEKACAEYAVRVLDYFADQGGFELSDVISPEQADQKGDTVYILWNDSEQRYQAYKNGQSSGLSPQTTVENASAIRACSPGVEGDDSQAEDDENSQESDNASVQAEAVEAHEVEEVSVSWEQILKDMSKSLDADGDGLLDGDALQIGSEEVRECSGLNGSDYSITCNAPEVVEVTVGDNALFLKPLARGEAQVVITPVDQAEEKLEFIITVRDYRLTWEFADNEVIAAGSERRPLVSCVDGVIEYILERCDGDDQWNKVDVNEYGLQAEGNNLIAEMKKPGQYRLTAAVDADALVYNKESRTFSVKLNIDAVEDVELISPYFKAQKGQRIDLRSGDKPALIEGCKVQIEPASLADAYLDVEKACIYIVPIRPGDGVVTLKDGGGEDVLTFAVKVNSLTRQPMLWILAVLIPICLIGLTVMVVILISKLRNR